MAGPDYLERNRKAWNRKTRIHFHSAFYDVPGFIGGVSSLNEPELSLLPDLKEKKLLHLQCHFGQDTLSLARLGAQVTGIDFSDEAITHARLLAEKTGLAAEFIRCDLYSLPQNLNEKFDIVFASYGCIGWLPDMDKWAAVIAHFLRPGGQFIFAEFHPFIWMHDTNMQRIAYDYFNSGPIVEVESGTYADRDAEGEFETVGWNHSLADVIGSLLRHGLILKELREYDYSPFNCFANMTPDESGKYRFSSIAHRIPVVYALSALKNA